MVYKCRPRGFQRKGKKWHFYYQLPCFAEMLWITCCPLVTWHQWLTEQAHAHFLASCPGWEEVDGEQRFLASHQVCTALLSPWVISENPWDNIYLTSHFHLDSLLLSSYLFGFAQLKLIKKSVSITESQCNSLVHQRNTGHKNAKGLFLITGES